MADEDQIRERRERCKPIVDEFFSWLRSELAERALLPSNPFTAAANYALERERALRVCLDYPNVPIDTNRLEREIRPIALGRKKWLFCWTEVGAECVEIHPASDVAMLTPRLWKEHFSDSPLRSDLDKRGKTAVS